MRKSIPMFDSQNRQNLWVGETWHGAWDREETHAAVGAGNRRRKEHPLSFLRHDEIYRSDVSFKNHSVRGRVPPPVGRPRGKDKGRGFHTAPLPSSAMSLGLGIPWQVALQQSLPPLPQPVPLCNDKRRSVEQISVDGTCLTDSVSQNSPQSTIGGSKPRPPQTETPLMHAD